MRKIKTLKNLLKDVKSQVTYATFKNGRVYVTGKGWTSFRLSEEISLKVKEAMLDALAGNKREQLSSGLDNSSNHWSFSRFIYNKKDSSFKYCAGQDEVEELNQIRKTLYARS